MESEEEAQSLEAIIDKYPYARQIIVDAMGVESRGRAAFFGDALVKIIEQLGRENAEQNRKLMELTTRVSELAQFQFMAKEAYRKVVNGY